MERIGLIAGNGRFPILFAQEARKNQTQVISVGIKHDTYRILKNYVDKFYLVDVRNFEEIFNIFQKENIKKVVMAGQVSPGNLFKKSVINDPRIITLFNRIKNRKADTIFGALADMLKEKNLELIDSTTFLKDYLPKKGALTKRLPTKDEWEDIQLGFQTAKAIGHLDIGQVVCVKQKSIVAVEAIEGTDNTIKRGVRFAGPGVTVVKVSKPNQDMRFDIPVAGLRTIQNLIKTKASCLAIEAEKTLLLDKEKAIALANKSNICIVAV